VILREQEEIDKQLEEVVFDHLHATAFQGQPLGRTILGPRENILSIKKSDLQNYISTNYRADRMVLTGAGGIPHEQLVELAEKHFSGLKPSDNPLAIGSSRGPKPEFIGSEVRMRDDTIPSAYISIAVEGVSWKDPDYFTALVAQAIVGNYDRAMGNAAHLGSKLSSVLHKHQLANTFMSFSTSYSDTGLWGAYMITENLTNIDDLVHFTLREWNRMAQIITEAEVERAKSQLKASLLLSLDGTTAIAEDIGRQIVTTGRRMNPAEIERIVSSITEKDVIEFVQKRIWDQDVAVSAVGSIEGVRFSRLLNPELSILFYN
jgi:processing peptidase subunit beta